MSSQEPIVIFSEPLIRPEFTQHLIVSAIAERLNETFDVTVAAPALGRAVEADFHARGVKTISGHVPFPPARHDRDEPPSFAEAWLLDAGIGANARWVERALGSNPALRLNFSMTNTARSDIYYFQARPLSESVRAFVPNLNWPLRMAAGVGLPIIDRLDRRRLSQQYPPHVPNYTVSRYVAQCYERRGVRVAGQVPPFPIPSDFAATTSNPSRDYALVYLAKETDMAAVRGLIALGMPVRLFGGKSAQWVRSALGDELPANVTMCGYVTHAELAELYTNALFTAFPFTDESFGLVPVESMACGTPVLTYAMQGPAETVVDGFTGWLAFSPTQFIEAARRLYDRGYPPGMQAACVERAQWYSLPNATRVWTDILHARFDGRDPSPRIPGAPAPAYAVEHFLPIRELVGSA
jgi:Glycosyl transferases group 1